VSKKDKKSTEVPAKKADKKAVKAEKKVAAKVEKKVEKSVKAVKAIKIKPVSVTLDVAAVTKINSAVVKALKTNFLQNVGDKAAEKHVTHKVVAKCVQTELVAQASAAIAKIIGTKLEVGQCVKEIMDAFDAAKAKAAKATAPKVAAPAAAPVKAEKKAEKKAVKADKKAEKKVAKVEKKAEKKAVKK
jgi:hypothetical protein